MPGKSKKGGGLEVGSAYTMKNSMLHMSAKTGSPMQANYGSPMKDETKTKKTLGQWFSSTKLGKDLKNLGSKMQEGFANIQHSTSDSRKKRFLQGFQTASAKRSKASEKRTSQVHKIIHG